MKKFKFIDLFSGIGGFRLALESQGGECVFSSEWDKSAQETYLTNFGETPQGDITKIIASSIPDHDILCGGFPCQAFSKSGRQKGFADIRGTLFFEIVRIAKEKKTPILFLENVANIKLHDQGRTFQVMKQVLEAEGYKVDEKVFNAKDFGLAQSRERIIIVATKLKTFDFTKIKFKPFTPLKKILQSKGPFDILPARAYTILPKHLWKTQKTGLIFCGYLNKTIRTKGTRPNSEHLSRVHKQPNRIYYIEGTHPTIPSQETSGRFWIYDGKKVRRLTLRECYRLQGFPEKFKYHPSKSEAYRQIGNSVPLNLIKAVADQVVKQLI